MDPNKIYAVVCGVNYIGTSHSLKGCIADANRMVNLLTSDMKVPRNNIILLTDDNMGNAYPTAHNIRISLEWLVRASKKGERVIFHFSGHGAQIRDTDGDEDDGMDEFIVPFDYPRSKVTDDELHALFVSQLACDAMILIDTCHSGSGCDLRLKYDQGKFIEVGRKSNTNVEVAMISGCRDAQTSADYFDGGVGKYGGAMTNAFFAVLKQHRLKPNYSELIDGMTKFMEEGGFNQRPQLTCNRVLDMNSCVLLTRKGPNSMDKPVDEKTDKPDLTDQYRSKLLLAQAELANEKSANKKLIVEIETLKDVIKTVMNIVSNV